MVLIHYGSRIFKTERFEKIKNTNWRKPDGGLWTCPIDAEDSWKSWCKSERFRLGALRSRMILRLRSKKILKIDSYADLRDKFIWIKIEIAPKFELVIPDFEKMAAVYDAIYLTSKGQSRTRLTQPYSLYGWDCECVLVLNKKKLKQLTKEEYEKYDKKVKSVKAKKAKRA